MSYLRYNIIRYHVSLSSYITGTEVGDVKIVAAIECEGTDGNRCLVYFVDEGNTLPSKKYNESTKTFAMYRPQEHYPWFIDILRNEKPMYCRIFTDNLAASGIDSGFEPVGEEEGNNDQTII